MRHRFSFLVLPLLMSVFPLLSFYLTNISELSPRFLLDYLSYILPISLLLAVGLFRLFRDRPKASLLVTLFLFVFFSYGHFSRFLDDKLFIPLPGGLVLGPDKIFIPMVILLWLVIVYRIIKSKKSPHQMVSYLTVILFVFVSWSSLQIIISENQKTASLYSLPGSRAENIALPVGELPDIYFIIPDGFARQDILSDLYGYDNSMFISHLESLGFYVAGKSHSNYMHTYLSLPSTLNMSYLDHLPDRYGIDPVDQSAAIELLFRNEVANRLKSYGYRTYSFASWWSGTGENYPADHVIDYEKNFQIAGLTLPASETDMVFLQTTLLSPLIKEIRGEVYRGKILTVFEKLPDIARLPGPKFVLAHITAPHPPYIFSRDGSPVPGSELENADEGVEKRGKYLDQLVFVSDRILPVVEKIIANSPRPPVIVLQSDHGPASVFGSREDWVKNFGPRGVAERSGILYSVFFPDGDYGSFYDTITPVNTFRVIFSKYFGGKMDLLPDKVFYTESEQMYRFQDVTDGLQMAP